MIDLRDPDQVTDCMKKAMKEALLAEGATRVEIHDGGFELLVEWWIGEEYHQWTWG